MADKTQNVKTRLSFDGEAEYKAACKEINSTLKVLNSEMKLVTAEYKDNASSVDALKAKQAVLQKTYDEQAKKVKETEAALEKCRKATGDNSEESKKLETQLNYQKAALVKTEQELGKTTDEMEKAEKAADEMGKEIKDSGEQADDAKGKFSGFTSVLSGMGTALKAAAAATAAAVAGAATAIGALTTKAIEGYAAQEQLVGGVETLFKTSSDTVVGYANDAYKTAGMSANEYMETVTSFSASLLASMNNDTAAAAEKANVAITDMSDNANKMGTDISLIQNAYNGFAKQNYTMLDNLKLGYGGTKEEMQRLLDDASKLSGIKYDISSYSDVVDAIHVVQTEMGITGTTAKEASTTIEGSVSSMSSAWDNWVAGMADSEANFSQLTSNLVDSIVTVVGNIAPRVIETVPRLVSGLGEIVEQLATYIPQVIQELLPPLMSGVQDLLNTLVGMLPEMISIIGQIIPTIIDTLLTILPQLLEAGVQIITELAQGIAQALPTLLPTIVTVVTSKYHYFKVYEPKERQIMALPFYDRVVQHAINNVLEPIFDKRFISQSYACRKGKGMHAASDTLKEWLYEWNKYHPDQPLYAIKADIHHYFQSIDHAVLKTEIRKVIKDAGVLALLDRIIDHNGNIPDGVGIPVGNLTSQLFANIYLDALDQFIKHELGVEAYIRYMDDFVILSPDKEQLRSWLARIEQFLREELKLEFNPKTTILAAKNGIDFVGYKHRATHRKVRKDSIKRIKRTIKKCESGKITKEQLQKSIQSWTGHAGHADSYNLRKKIETLAEAAIEKAA